MNLRPYQSELIAQARAAMSQGILSMVIQAPTGAGKTILAAFMLNRAAEKKMSSLFIVHRRELVKQSVKAFNAAGVQQVGVVASGFKDEPHHLIQVCSIQTLALRIHKLNLNPQLIVWDECHHIAAGSWAKIREMFPESFHIGVSATPERLDGAGLSRWFEHLILGPAVEWLIENKFLCPYKVFAPPTIDVSKVKTRMGDYALSDLEQAVDKPSITGSAVQEYLRRARGKRGVVFCVSIAHSKHVVEEFRKAGVRAEHMDGETPSDERDEITEKFVRGEIQILSNVGLISEGYDLPALEVLICLRPTQSLGLWLQMCGRVLRPSAGKEYALILDHAGNTERHGLPDQMREWNLKGRVRKKSAKDYAAVRVCPNCFAAQKPGSLVCHYCPHVFEVERREVEEVAGDLVELDKALFKLKREEQSKERRSAQTYEELVALGRSRGYRGAEFWARKIIEGRKKRGYR